MNKYVLESKEAFVGMNLIYCSGPISKSIDQLRQAGASCFTNMGRLDDGRAYYNFEYPEGKEVPYLDCLANDCCVVERRDE